MTASTVSTSKPSLPFFPPKALGPGRKAFVPALKALGFRLRRRRVARAITGGTPPDVFRGPSEDILGVPPVIGARRPFGDNDFLDGGERWRKGDDGFDGVNVEALGLSFSGEPRPFGRDEGFRPGLKGLSFPPLRPSPKLRAPITAEHQGCLPGSFGRHPWCSAGNRRPKTLRRQRFS